MLCGKKRQPYYLTNRFSWNNIHGNSSNKYQPRLVIEMGNWSYTPKYKLIPIIF